MLGKLRLYNTKGFYLGIDFTDVDNEIFDHIHNGFFKRTFTDRIWVNKNKSIEKDSTVDVLFEDGEFYYTYVGYLNRLIKFLDRMNLEYECTFNQCVSDTKLSVDLDGVLNGVELYDFQKRAVFDSLRLKYGKVLVATGGGKTEIMLATIKILGKKSLVVCPSIPVTQQFISRALKRGFLENDIGCWGGGEKTVGYVTAITSQSLFRLIQDGIPKDWGIEVLIFDEFHHIQSDSWGEIFSFFTDVGVKYILGYTGTMYRSMDVFENKNDFISFGISGVEIANVGVGQLVDEGVITEPVVVPFDVKANSLVKMTWQSAYNDFIQCNEIRNKKIAELMVFFNSCGLSTMVAVKTKAHAELIESELSGDVAFSTITVFGNNRGREYDLGFHDRYIDYTEVAERFESGQISNIISTSVYDEGVDLPSVDAVILGFIGKSIIKVMQRMGRGLRKKPNKDVTFIIDFVDSGHPFTHNQFKKRKTYYLSNGIRIINKSGFLSLVEGNG